MTIDKLIAELDQALQFPGVANAWTMPIKARIDMLSTGIRTPVGVKVFGKDLAEMETARTPGRGRGAARCPAPPAPTPSASPAATTSTSSPTARQLARYGLIVGDVQDVIATALGGETVTTTVEGRERFGVSVRYPRDLRSDPQAIATPGAGAAATNGAHGAARPGGQGRAAPRARPRIRTENALLSAYIYVDIRDRDIGSYVADAQQGGGRAGQVPARLLRHLERPVRVHGARQGAKLKIVVPVTLLIIFLLLYLNFRRLTETLIVMLSVPFALVGGIWLMWWLGYNLSASPWRSASSRSPASPPRPAW